MNNDLKIESKFGPVVFDMAFMAIKERASHELRDVSDVKAFSVAALTLRSLLLGPDHENAKVMELDPMTDPFLNTVRLMRFLEAKEVSHTHIRIALLEIFADKFKLVVPADRKFSVDLYISEVEVEEEFFGETAYGFATFSVNVEIEAADGDEAEGKAVAAFEDEYYNSGSVFVEVDNVAEL